MALLFPCSQLENTSQIAPIDKLNAIFSAIVGGKAGMPKGRFNLAVY